MGACMEYLDREGEVFVGGMSSSPVIGQERDALATACGLGLGMTAACWVSYGTKRLRSQAGSLCHGLRRFVMTCVATVSILDFLKLELVSNLGLGVSYFRHGKRRHPALATSIPVPAPA